MSEKDLNSILASISQDKLPPVEKWNPDFCGDMDLTIKRDGSWHYNNSPIGRQKLVKLFSTVIKKEGEDYFLVTPVEKLGIKVEDAPFLVVRMEIETSEQGQVIVFEDNCDNTIALTADNPLWVELDGSTGEPSPYVKVRSNLNALIHRNVFYELVELAQERTLDNEKHLGVMSANQFFSLGKI